MAYHHSPKVFTSKYLLACAHMKGGLSTAARPAFSDSTAAMRPVLGLLLCRLPGKKTFWPLTRRVYIFHALSPYAFVGLVGVLGNNYVAF